MHCRLSAHGSGTHTRRASHVHPGPQLPGLHAAPPMQAPLRSSQKPPGHAASEVHAVPDGGATQVERESQTAGEVQSPFVRQKPVRTQRPLTQSSPPRQSQSSRHSDPGPCPGPSPIGQHSRSLHSQHPVASQYEYSASWRWSRSNMKGQPARPKSDSTRRARMRRDGRISRAASSSVRSVADGLATEGTREADATSPCGAWFTDEDPTHDLW